MTPCSVFDYLKNCLKRYWADSKETDVIPIVRLLALGKTTFKADPDPYTTFIFFYSANFIFSSQFYDLPTAAAVLDVGTLVQSPMPKTLLYLTCWRVSLLTLRYPAASVRAELDLRALGALIGGTTCSIS